VIGERYREAPGRNRPRRRLLLLLLLLLLIPFGLGGISAELLHGAPKPCPLGASPGTSPIAAASPSPGASEVVGGVKASSLPTPIPSGTGGGGGQVVVSEVDFRITGGVGSLRPGVPTPIQLTLTNPNGVPIIVTALIVRMSAASNPPGCDPAANFQMAQSDLSTGDPITIPAGGSVTLTRAPRAPQITLLDLPAVNQDVCKNKSFVLTYSGSAHS
jgi:hypothetical protein